MRVLIAAHYASERLGGEAIIPLRIVRHLVELGHDVQLVTHEAMREELTELPVLSGRVHFAPGVPGLGWLLPMGERLPPAARQLAWAVTQTERQLRMVSVVRRLVREQAIEVVHQPVSVSPSVPSALRRLGAPLVVGPLNGGMTLPPAFRAREGVLSRARKRARQPLGFVLSFVLRGQREAAAILVANDRTAGLLPRQLRGRTRRISDVGVDPEQVRDSVTLGSEHGQAAKPEGAGRLKAIFVGRLVPLKGVDLLIEACADLGRRGLDIELTVVGDGPCRQALERQAASAGLQYTSFRGLLSRAGVEEALARSDVLVLPSLEEAGGAVVVEAMAAGLPVVVTDWGGPAYLVEKNCGITVPPSSREEFVAGLAEALRYLAAHPDQRKQMGEAGRLRVQRHYTWRAITEQMVDVYHDVVGGVGSHSRGGGDFPRG